MPINYADIIVYDMETVGTHPDQAKNPHEAWPVSLAAKAYNARTLEPHNNGEFYSLLKPPDVEAVHQECLDFVHMKREDLANAPLPSVVWGQFLDFVGRYNRKGDDWWAPISAGQNIKSFDSVIVERMNKEHNKKGKVLFSTFRSIDLMDYTFAWFENSKAPSRYRLKDILVHCGIEYQEDELHNALNDVRYTGTVLMKFLKLHRYLSPRVTWNGKSKTK